MEQMQSQSELASPHGNHLVNLIASEERRANLREGSIRWPSWDLTPRQMCDLELLMNGAFSPLTGFMTRRDHQHVLDDMRLCNNLLWPIPVVLDVYEDLAKQIGPGAKVALRDPEGVMLAVLHVEDVWMSNRLEEAEKVYETTSLEHPGVHYLLNKTNPWYLGGRIEGVQMPMHLDFSSLRLTPHEVRDHFSTLGWQRPIAFQTRNPMHRAHQELTMLAANRVSGKVLIHPVVGMTRPGDIDHFTRVRCYQALIQHYPENSVKLALLPLAMRMAGPREALWHSIIRKNFGCTHFIIGRDHAAPANHSDGTPFYEPYAAQDLMKTHEQELQMEVVPFQKMVYVQELNSYIPHNEVSKDMTILSLSGTELRELLIKGKNIPEWFTFKEVTRELQKKHPPRNQQGFTLFFTGLSGSGKSTIARTLNIKLLEICNRQVTLLDGDVVRKHLSAELGFSKAHRDMNVLRIGYVASLITKCGGVAVCAPIAPYDDIREEVLEMIAPNGGFILIHISTSLEVCEQRDCKGLYAKARVGEVKNFTGISDPYEEPENADLVIDTATVSPTDAVEQIISYLTEEGYIPSV